MVARVVAVGVGERCTWNIDKVATAAPVGAVESFEHRIHLAGGGVIQRWPLLAARVFLLSCLDCYEREVYGAAN